MPRGSERVRQGVSERMYRERAFMPAAMETDLYYSSRPGTRLKRTGSLV